MIEKSEAIHRAQEFLNTSGESEIPLVVDEGEVIVRDGVLYAPCNSSEYIRTKSFEAMVIGCTPVRVDLQTGECRFLSLEEAIQLDV